MADALSTQIVIETAGQADSNVNATQLVIEYAQSLIGIARSTQIVIEVGRGTTTTPPPVGGIYFINPNKTTKHDSYYEDSERRIPNPTIRTALFGE